MLGGGGVKVGQNILAAFEYYILQFEGFDNLKTESFRGLRPLDPRQGPYGGPLDPTRKCERLRARVRALTRTNSHQNIYSAPPLSIYPGAAPVHGIALTNNDITHNQLLT